MHNNFPSAAEGEAKPSLVAMYHHGGNLKSAQAAFPDAPLPWIDLSTGINPVPWPVGQLSAAAWTRLPEAAAIAGLEGAAAGAFGPVDPACVVAAPGTQALIQWLPRLAKASQVAILGFTYGEHALVWQAAGAAVTQVGALGELAAFDVAVAVNPNNPDGRLAPVADLVRLSGQMAAKGGLLVVDEAFADVLPQAASLASRFPADGAVVLRSFGKTWGLAGLRLGFAIAAPSMAGQIRAALGPWAISGAAVEIGAAALADRSWLTGAGARLEQDGKRLDALLAAAGFSQISGTPLFRFAYHPQAQACFTTLAQLGILVRPFPARPHHLRFGLPAGQDWERLERALAKTAARHNSPAAPSSPHPC